MENPARDSALRANGMMRWSLGALVLLAVLWLLFLGTTMKNDTYDAYDYMAGGRALAQSHPSWYPSIRPFGPSLLATPWTKLLSRKDEAPFLFRVLHLQSTLLSLLFLGVAALVFRELGRTGVLLPLALLSLCRLLPRYGWSFLSDIPAALLIAAGFLVQFSGHKKGGRRYLWSAVFFGLAANFKFYLLVSIGLGALAWLWVWGGTKKEAFALVLCGLLTGLGMHLLTAYILSGYHMPGLQFWSDIFGGQFLAGAKIGAVGQESRWAYLPLFAASCGWPAPLLALVGIVVSMFRKDICGKLLLLWCGGLGVVLYLAGHHEARYLFPILVPLIWAEALGVRQIGVWLSSSGRDRTPLVVFVALAAAFWPMVQEAVGLSESWLRKPVQQNICRKIVSQSGGCEEFLFVGPFYPLILSRELFSSRDDYYSIFHLGASQLIFWEEVHGSFVVGAPDARGYWLPPPSFQPATANRILVVSGFRTGIQAASLESALRHPQNIVLIREELSSTDQGAQMLEKNGAKGASLRVDLFSRGSDGKLSFLPRSSNPGSGRNEISSVILKRRFGLQAEIPPEGALE